MQKHTKLQELIKQTVTGVLKEYDTTISPQELNAKRKALDAELQLKDLEAKRLRDAKAKI